MEDGDRGTEPNADDETAVAGNQQSEVETQQPDISQPDNSERLIPGEILVHPAVATDSLAEKSCSASEIEKADQKQCADTEKVVSDKPEDDTERAVDSKKASSFAQLVKTWESYIADAQNADKFQPMQMLQSLGMCGAGTELPRLQLAPSQEFTNHKVEGQDPFEPIILRHTHSTPLQYRPSFFNEDGGGTLPPPSQLDSTRRSSSTPSRGSAFQHFSSYQSFGTHMHTASSLSMAGGRSAFGFPLNRSYYSGVSTESNLNIRSSAFNPVPFTLSTTMEEPQEEEEKTSIEVISAADPADPTSDQTDEQVEVEVELDSETSELDMGKPSKKSAAARAARFLSDVGVLRRKKKGARGSIASTISSDKDSSRAKLDGVEELEENATSFVEVETGAKECSGLDEATQPTMYHQLDSDVDEEFDRYQSIENTGRDSEDSGATPPLPQYHPIEEDRLTDSSDLNSEECHEPRRPAVRIQVSSNITRAYERAERINHYSTDTGSPDPESGAATPDTNSSPGGATRSSATTTTSGHTTQATSITSTTNTSTGNSQISETDREVMEANKEGKRRRREESQPEADNLKNESDSNVTVTSSSSASSTTNGYVALASSPGPLREGASVVADRFFRNSQSPVPAGGYSASSSCGNAAVVVTPAPVMAPTAPVRRTSTLTRRSNRNGSPTNGDEAPPTFVSYLDRQAASDLTSLRGVTEASIYRGDVEEREDSPAEIIGYPASFFGEAAGADGQENAMSVLPKLVLPSKESLYGMLERFRSRPPRSPAKGMRSMTQTPPPRIGSPAYHHQVSPPRKIIDHRIETNVSRPYVVRTNPMTQKLVLVSPGSFVRPVTPLVCIPVGSRSYSPNHNQPLSTLPEQMPSLSPYGHMMSSRTYEEHNIEILKSDSKDEMICQHRFASPELGL